MSFTGDGIVGMVVGGALVLLVVIAFSIGSCSKIEQVPYPAEGKTCVLGWDIAPTKDGVGTVNQWQVEKCWPTKPE